MPRQIRSGLQCATCGSRLSDLPGRPGGCDAVSRPSATHVFLEKELERLGRDPAFAAEIFGAVTLASHASLLIQLVDVVVGAVRHAEVRRRGYPQRTNTPKAAVADEVLALLTRLGDDQGRGGGPSRSFVVRTAPGSRPAQRSERELIG